MRSALMYLLLLAAPAFGQTVKVDAEVKVKPGRLAHVTVVADGTDTRWEVLASADDLDVIREFDPAAIKLAVLGYNPGTYWLIVATTKDGKLATAKCKITVGDPPPPTPPVPPTPPTPPPSPAPIPGDGLRALIVIETADLSKLPAAQATILTAQSVRAYLNGHCAKADGQPEWRIWDQNTDASGDSQLWQDALKRKRGNLPWLIVSNGKSGYEGPLPATVDDVLKLLQTYGGN